MTEAYVTKEQAIAYAMESSRQSFEERVWLDYCAYCNEGNLEIAERNNFFKRYSDGDYYSDYIGSLWKGWQWCYEICKTPVK